MTGTGLAILDAVAVEHVPPSPLAGRWAHEIGEGEPPRWLAKGWLPCGVLAVLYGEPGSFKSFVALDLALSLAAGRDWLGRRTASASALYLALEGGGGVARRIAAWRRHHGIGAPEAFRLVTVPVALIGQDAQADALIAEARFMADAGHAPDLIVVDTLSRALSGGDENGSGDMGALVRAADRVKDETGAAVLLVHHCGKDASRGARGHSLLRGAADVEIEARGAGKLAAELTLTKSKDGEAGLALTAELVSVELGIDADGDPITSLVPVAADTAPLDRRRARLTDRPKIALDALERAIDDAERGPDGRTRHAVRLSVWRDYCDTAGLSLADTPDAKRKAFQRAAERLQSLGFVTVYNDTASLTGQPDKGGQF